MFHLDHLHGELTVGNPLDYETKKDFSLLIEARDSGSPPFSSFSEIRMNVTDVNDNFPQFTQDEYRCEVFENSPPSAVCDVFAIDADSPHYSTVWYSLVEENDYDFFTLDPETGLLSTTVSLDRETVPMLNLTVEAAEVNEPLHKDRATVIITVLDRNDNAPRFTQVFLAEVPEDALVGQAVVRLTSTDDDEDDAAIIYYIRDQSEDAVFNIDSTTGWITVKRPLDREKQARYVLKVIANDSAWNGGWFPRMAILNVTVMVMDVNDNPPMFSSSEYTASVPENSRIGTVVLDLHAADLDSGVNAQISYSLIAGHVDKFEIDPRNGTITTLDVFDYEQEQNFDLTIKASNSGRHTLFSLTRVVVAVSDVNEFTPTFLTRTFNFSVFKNVPVGTAVGRVTATDGDGGSEGRVFYLMFGHGRNKGFNIDQLSGEMRTSASLRNRGNSHVAFKVLAKNSGVISGTDEDEAAIHVSVIDINDAPTFTSACYVGNVTEDSPPGTSVLTVSALDQDYIPDWNRFFFSIENGNTNYSFSIDPPSGVISVNSSLDRELWSIYNLTVTAIDNGSPPATGTTNVIVTIGDVNDNEPQLTSTEAQVKENQPGGTVVAMLNASDADLPPNQGPFTYRLLNLSETSSFLLTPDGVLLTTRTIDRENISEYRVLVLVQDAGHPGGILIRCLRCINWLLSMWRSSGSTLSPSRMTELLTLSLRRSTNTLRRELILAACIRSLALSVTTQSL
uniref:Cadherin domain-containing protein n=1 Tax=Nothobranchius furzeri TaxID=105023 RepID=A0A8C6KJ02_NOTFU